MNITNVFIKFGTAITLLNVDVYINTNRRHHHHHQADPHDSAGGTALDQ
jgi:hypothetical protein